MPKMSHGASKSCVCAARQSPDTFLPSAFTAQIPKPGDASDPEAKGLGCFLTLLGPWGAGGWARRVLEAEGSEGWVGALEPACRHLRPPGPGRVAGAQRATLTPSPTSPRSASLSERAFHILFRWVCGVQGTRQGGQRRAREPRLFLPPPGAASLWDLQVPLLSQPQFPGCYRRWRGSVQRFSNSNSSSLHGRRS